MADSSSSLKNITLKRLILYFLNKLILCLVWTISPPTEEPTSAGVGFAQAEGCCLRLREEEAMSHQPRVHGRHHVGSSLQRGVAVSWIVLSSVQGSSLAGDLLPFQADTCKVGSQFRQISRGPTTFHAVFTQAGENIAIFQYLRNCAKELCVNNRGGRGGCESVSFLTSAVGSVVGQGAQVGRGVCEHVHNEW